MFGYWFSGKAWETNSINAVKFVNFDTGTLRWSQSALEPRSWTGMILTNERLRFTTMPRSATLSCALLTDPIHPFHCFD